MNRRVASYSNAIFWMAANDDTEWVNEDPATALGSPSVTASLTADLFGRTEEEVRADLKRELKRQAKARA
jgi:hypothetical protein